MSFVRLFAFACIVALSSNCFAQSGQPAPGGNSYYATVYDLYVAEPTEVNYLLMVYIGPGESRLDPEKWEVVGSSPDPQELVKEARQLMAAGFRVTIQEAVTNPDWELFETFDNEADAEAIADRFERMGFTTRIVSRTVSLRPTYPRGSRYPRQPRP